MTPGRRAGRGPAAVSLQAAAATTAVSILWGGNIVSMKIAMAGVSPLAMAAVRFSLGAMVIFLWMLLTGTPLRPTRSEAFDHGINGLLFSGQISLFYLGTHLTSASHAVILINSNVVFLAVLAHFLIPGDRLTPAKSAGLLLAFAGAASLFLEAPGGPHRLSPAGDLLVLASAILLGVKTVFVKKLTERVPPATIVLWQMLIGVPVFAAAALAFEPVRLAVRSPRILLALLYQGVVVAGFCFVAATYLLKRNPPTAISVFFFVIPVSGVALSHWILGEPLTRMVLAGTALVAIGIVLVNRREKVVVELDEP